MNKLKNFPLRYAAYALSLAGFLTSLIVSPWIGGAYLITLAFGLLATLGTYDLLQRHHTI